MMLLESFHRLVAFLPTMAKFAVFMVLFTSILGPVLTEHFTLRMLELDRPATGNLPA